MSVLPWDLGKEEDEALITSLLGDRSNSWTCTRLIMVPFLLEYTCNGFVVAGSEESTPIDSMEFRFRGLKFRFHRNIDYFRSFTAQGRIRRRRQKQIKQKHTLIFHRWCFPLKIKARKITFIFKKGYICRDKKMSHL